MAVRLFGWLAAAVLILSAPASASNETETALRGLAQADEAVHRVGYRLIRANAHSCPAQRPDIGALLQDLRQYPADIRPLAARVLGLSGEIGFTAIAPDSPAAQAGIRPGTALLAINGTPVADKAGERPSAGRPDHARLERVELLLEEALRSGPARLSLRQPDGTALILDLAGEDVCAIRLRVQPSASAQARADDSIIEVNTGLVAAMRSDGELAAILAHELGHVVLDHYAEQEAQGVGGGLRTLFGRSRRVMRDHEEQADRVSVRLMHAAGYDPQEAIALWSHFAAWQHSFLSLGYHGSRAERRKRIAEEIAVINVD